MKKLTTALVLMGCVCWLFGCTVTSDDIAWSESMCRPNNGLKSIKNDGVGLQTVTCGNDATFTRTHDIFR